jgi:ankyrin repeat protein
MGASQYGHLELVRTLLAYSADINAKDDSGETTLSLASSSGYQDIVRLLKEAGAR